MMKGLFNLLSIFLLSVTLGAASASAATKGMDKVFVGTVYNIFHEEYASDEAFFKQVDIDIPRMKAANITHVLIFPMSQWDPDTKQLLWKRTDYLIKRIESQGLLFVPLMLKEQQASHYFPIWAYQDTGLWSKHFQAGGNRNTREDVDFADPKVYPYVEAYFKAVAERYGKSPALAFYNIWNEPHYAHKSPAVEAAFREWLQKKYGSLAALRHSWGEDYSDWSQVSAFMNDDWDSSMPRIDWTLFHNEYLGQLLGKLKATLLKYDATHAVNANPVNSAWTFFSEFDQFATDNWQFTANNDINGLSYYPDAWDRGHPNTEHPLWLHNFTFNTVRSTSGEKDYVLTEMYTNAKTGLTLAGYLDDKTMNRTAWAAFANNAKGILFWKWEPFKRGRQSLGRGLTQVNGELAPRGEAVKSMGEVIAREGKALYQAKPIAAEVAVIFDMVGLLKNQEESTDKRTTNFMFESNMGVFKALDEANISSDMLRADMGITLAQLSAYKAVFLPFQLVMRRDLAKILNDYVAQGGHLIADARTATLDELDFAYNTSPAGLETLFGAERLDWVASPNYYKALDTKGKPMFEGRFFREQLGVKPGTQVLATFSDNSEPALVQHIVGKGLATLAATALGASYLDRADSGTGKLIVDLAKQAGAQPFAWTTHQNTQSLSLRVHEQDKTLFVYAINPSHSPVTTNIHLTMAAGNQKHRATKNKVREIISNQSIDIEHSSNGDIEIPVKIGDMGVAVYRVE